MKRLLAAVAALLVSSLAPAGEVGFFPPVRLDVGDDRFPALATDGAQTWVVVWEQSEVSGRILTSRSSDGGVTWSLPAEVDPGESGRAPQIATDGTAWVVVWQRILGSDFDIFSSRSLDGGVTWSAPVTLNANAVGDTRSDQHAVIAAGDGAMVVAWMSSGPGEPSLGGDRDVIFTRSTDGGASWSVPAALNTDATTDSASSGDFIAALATDGAGVWIAVWRYVTFSPLPFDSETRLARSVDGGLTWAAPVSLDTNALTAAAEAFPGSVASDGAGTWVVTWSTSDIEDGTPSPLGEDNDLLFARSTDGGASWSPAAPLNTNAATDKGEDVLVDIANDGAGTWLAVWQSDDTLGRTLDTDTDVLVSWSSDSATWSPPEPLDRDAAGDSNVELERHDEWPRIVSDGAGTWMATWHQEAFASLANDPADILIARGPTPGCAAAPLSGCNAAGKASLRINESVPGKENLKGAMSQLATAVGLGDLGDPVGGDSLYQVCVYDEASVLIGEMVVPRAGGICGGNFKPCWQLVKGAAFSYGDAAAWSGGVRRLKAQSGSPDQAKIVVKGKNKTAQFPTGMAAALAGSPSAKVQIAIDDGICLEADVTTVGIADGVTFSATR